MCWSCIREDIINHTNSVNSRDKPAIQVHRRESSWLECVQVEQQFGQLTSILQPESAPSPSVQDVLLPGSLGSSAPAPATGKMGRTHRSTKSQARLAVSLVIKKYRDLFFPLRYHFILAAKSYTDC